MITSAIINTRYDTKGKTEGICWDFCRQVCPQLPEKPYLGMIKIPNPKVGCVIMFKIGDEWHSGIAWPDCLHVVHVKPERNGIHMIRKDRLTLWPWSKCLEGFYVPC